MHHGPSNGFHGDSTAQNKQNNNYKDFEKKIVIFSVSFWWFIIQISLINW